MDKHLRNIDSIKTQLSQECEAAIKTLIQTAEESRKSKLKTTNYLNSYFKKAKDHIL